MKNKNVLHVVLLPFLCAVIGCILLFMVSLIPNGLIYSNASVSAEQLKNMPSHFVIDESDSSRTLDIYTDQLIVMESYTLSRENPDAVLLNPLFEGRIYENFDALVNEGEELNGTYSRYWMGFRLLYRPLLMFTDYYGMTKFVGAILCILGFWAAAAIGKRFGVATALSFAFGIALVNPAVIASSLQFCCCFILAFWFLLMVLKFEQKPQYTTALFCFFGIATQFFDFYTVPILCYGFPALLLIQFERYSDSRWRTVLTTVSSWLYGYVSMWLVKLLAVFLFTTENGFDKAFSAFSERVGIVKVEGLEEMYNVVEALKRVWWTCCPGENEALFFFILFAVVLLSAIVIYRKKGIKELVSCGAILGIAVFPVIWIIASAQPINIHYYFQYRGIAVLFAGIMIFGNCALTCRSKDEDIKTNQ